MKQKHEDNHGFETVPWEMNESPKLLEKMILEQRVNSLKNLVWTFLPPLVLSVPLGVDLRQTLGLCNHHWDWL